MEFITEHSSLVFCKCVNIQIFTVNHVKIIFMVYEFDSDSFLRIHIYNFHSPVNSTLCHEMQKLILWTTVLA